MHCYAESRRVLGLSSKIILGVIMGRCKMRLQPVWSSEIYEIEEGVAELRSSEINGINVPCFIFLLSVSSAYRNRSLTHFFNR